MKSSRTEARSSSQIATIQKPQQLAATTHQFKDMCTEAQQKLEDLTKPGSLLTQLPAVVNEWQSLLKLKEVYEVRFFMLSLESLRLNSVVAEMKGLTMDLTREKETLVEEFKLSKRKLLEDQARNLQVEFERRLEAIRHEHLKELHGLKQRSEHLQIENENQAANLANYTQRIQSDHSLINNLKMQIDGLERRLQQSELATNSQKHQLKSWYDGQLKEAESRFSEELANQQRSAADLLRQREDLFHKEKADLETLVKRYEHEVSSLRNSTQDNNLKMISLQSALGLAESKLKSRDEALNAQQVQFGQIEASFKEQHELMKADLEEKLFKERAAKENEKREREKEIKSLRSAIEQAENRSRAAESANAQLKEELAREKKVIAVQAAKIESEKTEETNRLKKEFTIIEETLREERVTLETQIWNLHSKHALEKQILQGELEQSKAHLEKLGQELENWKREFNSFDELRARKQAEIEQYEAKYNSYLSPEDAKQLQEDYSRAKSQAKTLEDENTYLSQSLEDHKKKIQALEFDLGSKIKRAEQLEKQLQEKRRELEELESRCQHQQVQIRGLTQAKDSAENQLITHKQKLSDLETDLKRIKSERDASQTAYENLYAKYSEFSNEVTNKMRQKPEDIEMLKKNSTQSTVTMVRQSTKLSQIYTSGPQGNS